MADDLLPDLLVLLDDGDVEMLLMGDDKDEREIEGGMDGFKLFRDSMPSFNLDEFFRMMPELRMDIPEQLQEEGNPKEPKRKKKRKIYKI